MDWENIEAGSSIICCLNFWKMMVIAGLIAIGSNIKQCLSDETYDKLKYRFELIKNYAINLESKIIEHNKGQKK